MIDALSHLTLVFSIIPDWLTALTAVISAASAVTALTPTPKDDRFLARLHKVLEIAALNIGHAKRR